MSTQPYVDETPLKLLTGILKEANHSLVSMFIELTDSAVTEVSRQDMYHQVQRLRHEISASLEFSCALHNDGTGWPDIAEDLATFTGARSGFPSDLVNGMLAHAQALTSMVLNYCKGNGPFDKAHHTLVFTALSGIHSLLQLALNVIECPGVEEPVPGPPIDNAQYVQQLEQQVATLLVGEEHRQAMKERVKQLEDEMAMLSSVAI